MSQKDQTLSPLGSPDTVSSQDANPLSDQERLFKHGSTGSQGGDRGNEYQALWMTLSCLNAINAPPNQPKLKEIILEGESEPYDDVVLRKDDGSFTLFQSKHRDKSGSDNITIGELTKLPPIKGGKSSGTAFSLPKYFMGMMKEYKKDQNLAGKRFVICVSAPFSTIFEHKVGETKKRVYLEENTWTTDGIFQNISPGRLDPLFTSIFLKNEKTVSLSTQVKRSSPEYGCFTDNFINGVNITANQTILRTLIFGAIKTFIEREKKSDWVTPNMIRSPDHYIKLFLRNLQWWIKQPKLEELRDNAVKFAISENFGGNVDTIHREFYEIMRNSSSRNTKSLGLKEIELHLRIARGKALSSMLRHSAGIYHEDNLLAPLNYVRYPVRLKKFLSKSQQPFCIVSSDTELTELKYLTYRALSDSKETGKAFEDWVIVDAMSKPIHHQHSVLGHVDYDIGDIFLSNNFRVIVLDNVDQLLNTRLGRQQLKILLAQKMTKIVLIASPPQIESIRKLTKIKITSYKYKDLVLEDDAVERCLEPEEVKKKTLALTTAKTTQPFFSVVEETPSLHEVLRTPSVMANFLKTLLPRSARVTPSDSLRQFEVDHYVKLPLYDIRPFYELRSALLHYANWVIHLIGMSPEELEEVKPLISDLPFKITTEYDTEDHQDITIFTPTERNNTTDILIFEVLFSRKSEDIFVLPHAQNHEVVKALPRLEAAGFKHSCDDELLTLTDYDVFLVKEDAASKTLISADYGTGKSSLIKCLFLLWADSGFNRDHFDFVVPCHLTKIFPLVEKDMSLVDILICELQRQHLFPEKTPRWLSRTLSQAIVNGRLLILFDRWDELLEQNYGIMNEWLTSLPATVSFMLATRPHAESALNISFQQKIELSLFTWEQIHEYISNFIKALLPRDQQQALELTETITSWLGNGNNKDVTEMLSRPLHLRLLCDAIKPHVLHETKEPPPWFDDTLYRLKLYQLIMHEQFRRYIIDQVQARALRPGTELQMVNLFTQAHQVRLRELGFELIFEDKPIPLLTALNDDVLISELFNIGILSKDSDGSTIEFLHRIFAEYFAAQYIYNGLLRGKGDVIFDFVVSLIQKNAADERYQEVWRLLGEIHRFGEPMLCYNPSKDASRVSFQQITEDDLCGAYFAFFRNCVSNKKDKSAQRYHRPEDSNFYSPEEDFELKTSEAKEEYAEKTLLALLGTAKSDKNAAVPIIRHLIATNQLTDNWLSYFYYRDDTVIGRVKEHDMNQDCERSLSKLDYLVRSYKWPEGGWNGYKDIDAYLPCIAYMQNKLYVHAAAYFIHRLSNPGARHFDYGLASAAGNVIEQLANANFEDIESLRLFFMMLRTWLRKTDLIRGYQAYLIPGSIGKCFQLLEADNTKDQLLATTTLFDLAYTFQMRLLVHEKKGTFKLILISVNNEPKYKLKISQDIADLIKQFAEWFKIQRLLPIGLLTFSLDGSDLKLREPLNRRVIEPSNSTEEDDEETVSASL